MEIDYDFHKIKFKSLMQYIVYRFCILSGLTRVAGAYIVVYKNHTWAC